MSTRLILETWQAPSGEGLRYAKIEPSPAVHSQAPIIFVPGLGGSVKSAVGFLSRFALAGHPVYSLDAPGWGINDHQACLPNPEMYLQLLTAFVQNLQSLGIIQPSHGPTLMGLSLGGVLASLQVARSPGAFEKLVLLAPAFRPHPKTFSLRYRLKAYGSVLTKGWRGALTMPYGVHELTQNPVAHADPHLQERLKVPLLYVLAVDRLCQKAQAALSQIQVPVAMVVPQADLVCCPTAMQRAFEKLKNPNKSLWALPQLFHDIPREPEDALDIVCTPLIEWLQAE